MEAEWSDEENEVPSDIDEIDNEEDLKRGKIKVSDDLEDESRNVSEAESDDDDSEEESEDDEGKFGGEDESDHEEEDAKPTLTSSVSGGQYHYVASLDFHNNLIASIPPEVRNVLLFIDQKLTSEAFLRSCLCFFCV
jgi:hypothetical protein